MICASSADGWGAATAAAGAVWAMSAVGLAARNSAAVAAAANFITESPELDRGVWGRPEDGRSMAGVPPPASRRDAVRSPANTDASAQPVLLEADGEDAAIAARGGPVAVAVVLRAQIDQAGERRGLRPFYREPAKPGGCAGEPHLRHRVPIAGRPDGAEAGQG